MPHGHGYHRAANKGAYAGSFYDGRRCGIGALSAFCRGCSQAVLQTMRGLTKHCCVRTRSTSQVPRAGVYRFANGDTFSGTFEADHPSGHGIYSTKLREHLEGEFHDGQVHGWGVRILPDGAMAAGEALLPATPSSADPSLLCSVAGLARRLIMCIRWQSQKMQ